MREDQVCWAAHISSVGCLLRWDSSRTGWLPVSWGCWQSHCCRPCSSCAPKRAGQCWGHELHGRQQCDCPHCALTGSQSCPRPRPCCDHDLGRTADSSLTAGLLMLQRCLCQRTASVNCHSSPRQMAGWPLQRTGRRCNKGGQRCQCHSSARHGGGSCMRMSHMLLPYLGIHCKQSRTCSDCAAASAAGSSASAACPAPAEPACPAAASRSGVQGAGVRRGWRPRFRGLGDPQRLGAPDPGSPVACQALH